jgi:hypothetical protein
VMVAAAMVVEMEEAKVEVEREVVETVGVEMVVEVMVEGTVAEREEEGTVEAGWVVEKEEEKVESEVMEEEAGDVDKCQRRILRLHSSTEC